MGENGGGLNEPFNHAHNCVQVFFVHCIEVIQLIAVDIQNQKYFIALKGRQNNFRF